MQTHGISRGDYERLPQDTKSEIEKLFDEIKGELRHCGFSLRFLGSDGHWKKLTAPKFLAHSEEHYCRLIMGSKWVTSAKRRELIEKISELHKLASKTNLDVIGLEKWLSPSRSNRLT
jgi:hypothetical protein